MKPSLALIIPIVLIAHLLLIAAVMVGYAQVPLTPTKRMVVSTVKLAPQVIALEKIPELTPPKVPESAPLKPAEVEKIPELKPASEEAFTPKPPAPKPPIPKKAPPKPQPKKTPPKKEEPKVSKPQVSAKEAELKAKQAELFKKAKEKMQNISKKEEVASPIALNIPTRIESLSIDSSPSIDVNINPKETAYRDELVHRLKLLLKLPTWGEVKVRLTVDRSGKVNKLEVIHAQNDENKTYIETALPKLKLPPFGRHFENLTEYTFNINISNE